MKPKTLRIAASCLAMLAMTQPARAWGDREQAALAGAVVGGLIASHTVNADIVGYPAPVGAPVYLRSPGVSYAMTPGYVTGPVYAPAPIYYSAPAPIYRAPVYVAGPTVGLYGPGWRSPIPPVVQYRPSPAYGTAYAPGYGNAFRERGYWGERGGGWDHDRHGGHGRHGGW